MSRFHFASTTMSVPPTAVPDPATAIQFILSRSRTTAMATAKTGAVLARTAVFPA